MLAHAVASFLVHLEWPNPIIIRQAKLFFVEFIDLSTKSFGISSTFYAQGPESILRGQKGCLRGKSLEVLQMISERWSSSEDAVANTINQVSGAAAWNRPIQHMPEVRMTSVQ